MKNTLILRVPRKKTTPPPKLHLNFITSGAAPEQIQSRDAGPTIVKAGFTDVQRTHIVQRTFPSEVILGASMS